VKLLERFFGASPGAAGRPGPPVLRLADSCHACRDVLARVVEIVDRSVLVEQSADETLTTLSTTPDEVARAIALLDGACEASPRDPDLLVAKAGLLHASLQFRTAEQVLDQALEMDAGHFEARMWKTHWETWASALRFPRWDERSSTLAPAMAAHLSQDRRVQIVRDGLQKALVVVASVQGPPFEKGSRAKVEWLLSEAPQGALVAWYLRVMEPSGEPSTLEGFLPIFPPTRFSPMEGLFLLQQLAFTPCLFVVLASGASVLLNQRVELGEAAIGRVREMARKVGSAPPYLPPDRFREAMQWHMSHFDVAGVRFD
jgi:hypothetical protein